MGQKEIAKVIEIIPAIEINHALLGEWTSQKCEFSHGIIYEVFYDDDTNYINKFVIVIDQGCDKCKYIYRNIYTEITKLFKEKNKYKICVYDDNYGKQ